MSNAGDDVVGSIAAYGDADEVTRVEVFNRVTAALRAMMRGVCDDPVLGVQLVAAVDVRPNDYNPNRVASVELDLLERSIVEDGVTMPVVVVMDGTGQAVVVDGFHRQRVIRERLHRNWVPCSVIDKPFGDRMASTIRHNRARGRHVVDLMGSIVAKLDAEGWAGDKIADHLGMSPEELLRLRQMTGAARALAATEYTRSAEAVDVTAEADPETR